VRSTLGVAAIHAAATRNAHRDGAQTDLKHGSADAKSSTTGTGKVHITVNATNGDDKDEKKDKGAFDVKKGLGVLIDKVEYMAMRSFSRIRVSIYQDGKRLEEVCFWLCVTCFVAYIHVVGCFYCYCLCLCFCACFLCFSLSRSLSHTHTRTHAHTNRNTFSGAQHMRSWVPF